MKLFSIFLFIVVAGSCALIAMGQMGLLAGSKPNNLGAINGRLAAPSATPNSVSSQTDFYPNHPQKKYAAIAPLAFTGDSLVAMTELATIVQGLGNTVILMQTHDYLYAQSTSMLFGFVDDMEFVLDAPRKVIQVRSASRLGRYDFGANRARIETIRTRCRH